MVKATVVAHMHLSRSHMLHYFACVTYGAKSTDLCVDTCFHLLSWHSLFFVAYAAEGQPQGGANGALVEQALAAIKKVDPHGHLPQLLAGLDIAEAIVRPSFMLGSKQEAMVGILCFGACLWGC